MRPMLLEFPDDPAVTHLDRQYMLGDLLVAPVFTATGEVDFYLPAGRWTRLLTGEVVEGPGWVRETHGFASVPLYGPAPRSPRSAAAPTARTTTISRVSSWTSTRVRVPLSESSRSTTRAVGSPSSRSRGARALSRSAPLTTDTGP